MNIKNTIQRCDFRMHDMIDGKFRVERVLSSTQTDQKFKVNDTSLDVGVNLADLSKIGKRLLIAGIIIVIIFFWSLY